MRVMRADDYLDADDCHRRDRAGPDPSWLRALVAPLVVRSGDWLADRRARVGRAIRRAVAAALPPRPVRRRLPALGGGA